MSVRPISCSWSPALPCRALETVSRPPVHMDEDAFEVTWYVPPPLPEFSGVVSVGGSCSRRIIKELSRAS
eukprot:2823239-Pyramimonas_sp.AAC.1